MGLAGAGRARGNLGALSLRRLSPIAAIFVTVLLAMLSFGMAIPDIQVRSEHLGAMGFVRGLLLASFSIAQLLTAPFLGRLSDRIGRRKVLLVTTLIGCVASVTYSQAHVLWVLFAARALNGIAGANLGVAFAYISDVTSPQDRAKSLGVIGAAFGMGFVFGPPVGAYLLTLGHGGPEVLGMVSAAFALVNFLFVWKLLPESPSHLAPVERGLAPVLRALRDPAMGLLLGLFFLMNFALSNLESTFFLLTQHKFEMTQQSAALVLAWVGIVGVVMQGGVVGWVQPRLGELRMMRLGFLAQGPALAIVPYLPPWGPMLGGCLLLGIGNGLAGPSVNSLISRRAGREIQGGVFGVTQSIGAVARIAGPLTGSVLFDLRPSAPYLFAGALMLLPILGGLWVAPLDVESTAG